MFSPVNHVYRVLPVWCLGYLVYAIAVRASVFFLGFLHKYSLIDGSFLMRMIVVYALMGQLLWWKLLWVYDPFLVTEERKGYTCVLPSHVRACVLPLHRSSHFCLSELWKWPWMDEICSPSHFCLSEPSALTSVLLNLDCVLPSARSRMKYLSWHASLPGDLLSSSSRSCLRRRFLVRIRCTISQLAPASAP